MGRGPGQGRDVDGDVGVRLLETRHCLAGSQLVPLVTIGPHLQRNRAVDTGSGVGIGGSARGGNYRERQKRDDAERVTKRFHVSQVPPCDRQPQLERIMISVGSTVVTGFLWLPPTRSRTRRAASAPISASGWRKVGSPGARKSATRMCLHP